MVVFLVHIMSTQDKEKAEWAMLKCSSYVHLNKKTCCGLNPSPADCYIKYKAASLTLEY